MPYDKRFEETLYNSTWLERVYVTENRNAAQVAELIGCNRSAVHASLKRFGIPVKKSSEAHVLSPHPGSNAPRPRKRFLSTLHNPKWLQEHYVDKNLDATNVAHLAGASIPSTIRAIRAAGIEIRDSGEVRQGRANPARKVLQPTEIALRARARRKMPPTACEVCEKRGLTTPGVDVNHRDRNPLNEDRDNLERLCRPCHGQQHAEEERVMIEMLKDFGVSYLRIHEVARERLLKRGS